jgi:cob(I)alamin adenosyltransferase
VPAPSRITATILDLDANGHPTVAVGSFDGFRYLLPMKIYTRTGDKGETSLYGGQRLPKDALRIEAYGTVDELNSVLGIARAENMQAKIDQLLDRVQNTLFVLGADLATPRSVDRNNFRRISRSDAELLEQDIDELENSLHPLRNFILPGGAKSAAHLQLARAVCRRAERCVVRLAHNEDTGEDVLIYLNRLSDFLFVLARFANLNANVSEHPWKP